jgi:transportin-3
VEFELQPEAWQVAQALVAEAPGNNFRFYGANIFYNKIRRDFHQLRERYLPFPRSPSHALCSANSLKTALVELILHLSQETPLDLLVIRRVCLALAVLALQLNQRGVVNEILAYMNPIIATSPIILLELLTVLPEECFNRHIDVDNSIREEFSAQLSSSAPQVLEFLVSFTNPPPEMRANTQQAQIQLLRCFSRWIENTRISQRLLAQHPLLQFTLTALSNPNLFDEATDVIISLFRQYAGPLCLDDDMVLPAVLVPVVLSLSSHWNTDQISRHEEDEEVCRGVSRLFTEMVESYLYLITQSYEIGQDALMEQLLACAAYPSNSEIARIPLKGFYELSAFIKNSGEERAMLTDKYGFYFCRLVHIVVRQLQLTHELFFSDERLSGEELYVRDELKESLVDAMDVIGPVTVLEILVHILQQQVPLVNQPPSPTLAPDMLEAWKLIEAALVGVSVVANYLSPSEGASSFAYVIDLLVSISSPSGGGHAATDLSALANIRNTVVGKCAVYLSYEPRHLPALLDAICSGLMRPSVASSSAFALMLLFQNCEASHRLLPLDSFYSQLCHLRETGSLTLSCDLDILEGLCSIVSRLPLSDAKQTLQLLLEPIVNSLLLNADKSSGAVKLVMDDIERITILMSKTSFTEIDYVTRTDLSHPVVDLFLAISPFLGQILQRFPSESIAEKVCRCYKHCLNNVSLCSIPLLESLLGHVLEQYQLHSYSCYLYVCSIAVKIFGESIQLIHRHRLHAHSHSSAGAGGPVAFSSLQELIAEDPTVLYQGYTIGQVKATLRAMFTHVVEIFFTRHSSLTEFEEHPDIVEEFFYLMARLLQVAPIVFLDSPLSNTVLSAAIVGLNLNHREAQKGILLFVQRLVETPHCLRHEPPSPVIELIRGKSQQLLVEVMAFLVNQLLLGLSGQIPSYALDESHGSISDVLWGLRLFSPPDFQVSSLSLFHPSLPLGLSRNCSVDSSLLGAGSGGHHVVPKSSRRGSSPPLIQQNSRLL